MAKPSTILERSAAEQALLFDLISLVDDLLERSISEKRSLERSLAIILPAVAEKLGAVGVFVRSFGEDLQLRTFVSPASLPRGGVDAFLQAHDANHTHEGVFPEGDAVIVAQKLDVAGEWFGAAGIVVTPARASDDRTGFLSAALRVVCEQLDNYLHSIRGAREKHKIMMALAHALHNRVLADGLSEAVGILAKSVAVERLLIAVRAEQSDAATVHLQFYEGGQIGLDTMHGRFGTETPEALDAMARAYLKDESRELLHRLGFEGAQEEVLIHGVKETTLVGKVVVASKTGDFNTYDRELLAGFGDFVCQRVVDFNKEYRNLARSFRPACVDRMLRSSDYAARYLQPREKSVGMLYVDISGFTRVCEQILVDPHRIGRLVDLWGDKAVEILWEHDGVFDKMVGDCVIGLFGPPFYETSAKEQLANALLAAHDIRAMTNALPEMPEFEVLRKEGLAVSTGVHHAPLFVGTFGPNENFTGFSAGMNNTARLQAQAVRDEILVMEEARKILEGDPRFVFGELRNAKVKNVANPIEFRPLVEAKTR